MSNELNYTMETLRAFHKFRIETIDNIAAATARAGYTESAEDILSKARIFESSLLNAISNIAATEAADDIEIEIETETI